jgi:DNA-directed RNA polymerase specialized sigma24 family protein
VLGRAIVNEGDAALLQGEVGVWFDTLVERLPPKRREAFKLVRLYRVSYTE